MKLIMAIAVLAFAIGGSLNASAQSDAATIYKQKCASCHGADGKGSAAGTKLGVKDFSDPALVKQSDEEFARVIKEGKGKMPKFEGKLTDDQITILVKYIRTLQKK